MESPTESAVAHTVRSLFGATIALYDIVSSTYQTKSDEFSSRAIIDFERGRFWAWGEVLGFTGNGPVGGSIEDQPEANLKVSQEKVISIQNALQGSIEESEGGVSNSQTTAMPSQRSGPTDIREFHRSLQHWNDSLQSLLSPSRQSRMEILWPHRDTLPEAVKLSILDNTCASPGPRVVKPRPTAAMKYMGQLRKQHRDRSGKDLFVERTVEISSSFGEHSLAWYRAGDTLPNSPVLVEWKGYDSKWTSKIGEELYSRVGEIAELFHQPDRHGRSSLRVLNCTGWLHDLHECRFGFVYEIPETPVSLYTLMAKTKELIGGPPPLGMKFNLAAMMARCLLAVHSIGWLHKNISAHNIIFSPSKGAMLSTSSAYLIGFNHSRLDDEMAFTEGPRTSNIHLEYQHPEYRVSGKQPQARFHRIYDYYSLGLVLLEIGVWISFNQIAERKARLSPTKLQQYLIDGLVPKLDSYMGVVYRGAVAACLKGDFGSRCREESDEARKETLAVFESKVVQPLSCCFA